MIPGLPSLSVIGGVGLVIAALSGAIYVERLRLNAADARATVAERDANQWKNNFNEAARVAAVNVAAMAELKKRLAESAASADAAAAAAEANAGRYSALLNKVKEQHAPGDSSAFMRAYLDGLCVESTTAACNNY